jgi:hypothetical protein
LSFKPHDAANEADYIDSNDLIQAKRFAISSAALPSFSYSDAVKPKVKECV